MRPGAVPDPTVPTERLTIGSFVHDVAERFGDREALVCGEHRLTYRRLEGEARRIARALATAGVSKGTRVGVLMGNRPEMVCALFAVAMVGGVSVPISTFAAAVERDHVVRHSDTAVLLMEDQLAGHRYLEELARDHPEVVAGPPGRIRCRALPFLRRVVVLPTAGEGTASAASASAAMPGVERWDRFVGEPGPEDGASPGRRVDDDLLDAMAAEVTPYDDAITVYTSGTTAEPKAVLHLHRAVAGQFWRWGGQLGLGPEERVWAAFPFFWTAGLAMVLGGTLACGACLYLQEVFDPAEVLALIERERITTIHAFPHTDAQLADHPDARRRDLRSLVNVRPGSALGQIVGVVADERSWDMSAGYGSSETFTVSTALAADASYELRRSSHGQPLPGMEVRIVDVDTGEPLPVGSSGEIVVRGVYLMRTYYKVPPEECVDRGGWFHTQDAGYLDAEGNLHWHGRISGMIKTGGSNVSPVEVETRALEPGTFAVVTVVGLPHPTLGEAVVMCAVPLKGVDPDLPRVRDHLRATLASYKIPRRTLLFDEGELDFTASEKIRVEHVRARAAARLVATDDDRAWADHLQEAGLVR